MKQLKSNQLTQREGSFRLTLKKSRKLCLFGFRVQFRFKFCISK